MGITLPIPSVANCEFAAFQLPVRLERKVFASLTVNTYERNGLIMGRPKKSEGQRKTHVMPVRLSETQHEIISHNAAAAGMGIMDYIRHQAIHGKVNAEYRIVADFP